MLLAEVTAEAVKTPPGTPWWVTVGLMAVAGLGGWLFKVYRAETQRKRAEKVEDETAERQHRKEDDNAIIAGQNEFIERLKATATEDRKSYQVQLADLNAELGRLRTKLEACVTRQQKAEKEALKYQMRVQHLEELLEVNKVPFKRRDDDSGVISAPPEDSSKGDF